jgi:hypothetical protein
MDLLWIIIAGLFMVAGIAGCLIPLLPGPPISFIGLLILQLMEKPPFTNKFLAIWAIIVILITVLDYVVPIYGTKRFGGTRYGQWGCAIGLIAGFWFGPAGIIAGPFIGALLGELLTNKNTDHALKAAFGSFIGFLMGTVIKLIASMGMLYYYILTFFN